MIILKNDKFLLVDIQEWRSWDGEFRVLGGQNLVEIMENVKSLLEDIKWWKAWGGKSIGWGPWGGELQGGEL